MKDKRMFERISARFPLRFIDPSSGQKEGAQAVDISANGLGMITERDLNPQVPLEMWMHIPDKHEPLYTRGQVVWSEELGSSGQKRFGIVLEKAELMGISRVLRTNI